MFIINSDLLPCPFGCTGRPVLKSEQRAAFITDYWVMCPKCLIAIQKKPTPAAAIEQWNRRIDVKRKEGTNG